MIQFLNSCMSLICIAPLVQWCHTSTSPALWCIYSDLPLATSMSWAANAAEELATFAFYCLVGLRFKPQSGSPYLELSQEDQGPL